MKKNSQVLVNSAAAVLMFALSASPALAGQKDNRGRQQPSTSTHTSPFHAPQTAQPAPSRQPSAPAPQQQSPFTSRFAQQAQPQAAPRQQAPRQEAPRQEAPRQVAPQQSAPQHFGGPRPSAPAPTPQPRFSAPQQTAPQRYQAPQYAASRYEAPRYASPRYEAPRYVSPRYSSRVYVPTYRPYYTFRSRFSIGIGLFIGYPVAYPSWYAFPYRTFGYYSYPGYINAGPAYESYGAVSFDVNPIEAAVFVDGTYMGVVADFCPTEQPLTLSAGRHRIELTAEGFVPQLFDITVSPGLVLPLQGNLSYR